MNDRLRIREFHPSDLAQVFELSQRYASWDVTITRVDIMGFHSSEPDLFLVAVKNQKIVGFVYGKESNYPDEVLRNRGATKARSIKILTVSPEHRRQGIATRLLNSLLDIFKNKKNRLCLLWRFLHGKMLPKNCTIRWDSDTCLLHGQTTLGVDASPRTTTIVT